MNYGCGNGDCSFTTNSQGAVRFVVKPTTGSPELTSDFNLGTCGDGVCEAGETCQFCPEDCGPCPVTSPKPTTALVTSNPVKPCSLASCPQCSNNLASKLLRVTG